MKRNWLKWLTVPVLMSACAMPAMAVELKVHGEFSFEGRYYNNNDWVESNAPGAFTNLGAKLCGDMAHDYLTETNSKGVFVGLQNAIKYNASLSTGGESSNFSSTYNNTAGNANDQPIITDYTELDDEYFSGQLAAMAYNLHVAAAVQAAGGDPTAAITAASTASFNLNKRLTKYLNYTEKQAASTILTTGASLASNMDTTTNAGKANLLELAQLVAQANFRRTLMSDMLYQENIYTIADKTTGALNTDSDAANISYADMRDILTVGRLGLAQKIGIKPDAIMRNAKRWYNRYDNDSYYHYLFNVSPEIVLNDKASIKMKLSAYDNEVSEEEYGTIDDRNYAQYLFGHKKIDSYTVFRIDDLYGDVTTNFGRFILGKTAKFQGLGWFIKLPNLDNWAFGLIVHKRDEDAHTLFGNHDLYAMRGSVMTQDQGQRVRWINSDTRDETGYSLMAKYDTDHINMVAQLALGMTDLDDGDAHYWMPTVQLGYHDDNLKVDTYARYTNGTWAQKKSNKISNVQHEYRPIIKLACGEYAAAATLYNTWTGKTTTSEGYVEPLQLYGLFKGALGGDSTTTGNPYGSAQRMQYHNALATYVETSYKFDNKFDRPVTPIITLAYASGAKKPNQVDGTFEDEMTFGTWLMDDREEEMQGYFMTPATSYMEKDPQEYPKDYFSFGNIILARLGAKVELTKKTDVQANVIYAQKASVDYLEHYNPAFGIGNMMSNNTKISYIGKYNPNFDMGYYNKETDVYYTTPTAIKTDNALGSTEYMESSHAFMPYDKYKNHVDKGLGVEINGAINTKVNENVTLTLQASYLTAGSFYKTALEPAIPFGGRDPYSTNPYLDGANSSGMKAKPEYAARWIMKFEF